MNLRKKIALLLVLTSNYLIANEKSTNYIPLFQSENLNVSEQSLQCQSAGFVIEKENFLFVGITSFTKFEQQPLFEFPKSYLSIDVLTEFKKNSSEILFIYKSDADKTESFELQTLQTALVYGHRFIDKENFQLVFGGGLAVSDFGIECSDGSTLPMIPVPLLRINSHNQLFTTKFEFITSPNLDITFLLSEHIKATFEGRFDQLRDERDLLFESKLHYRFFSASDDLGDIAGVALGFKNGNHGAFNLAKRDNKENETLEIQYRSIFAELDLTLLKLSAGHAFQGRELYQDGEQLSKQNVGDGYFWSVQALYQF